MKSRARAEYRVSRRATYDFLQPGHPAISPKRRGGRFRRRPSPKQPYHSKIYCLVVPSQPTLSRLHFLSACGARHGCRHTARPCNTAQPTGTQKEAPAVARLENACKEVFDGKGREVGSTTPSRPALPPGCLDDARHRCTYLCASGDRRGPLCTSVLTHGPREKRIRRTHVHFTALGPRLATRLAPETCLACPEAADAYHFIGFTRRGHSRDVRSQSDPRFDDVSRANIFPLGPPPRAPTYVTAHHTGGHVRPPPPTGRMGAPRSAAESGVGADGEPAADPPTAPAAIGPPAGQPRALLPNQAFALQPPARPAGRPIAPPWRLETDLGHLKPGSVEVRTCARARFSCSKMSG